MNQLTVNVNDQIAVSFVEFLKHSSDGHLERSSGVEKPRHGTFKVRHRDPPDYARDDGHFSAAVLHEVVGKFRGTGRARRASSSARRFFFRDTVRTQLSVLLRHTNTLPTLHPSRVDLAPMTTSHWRTRHRSHCTIVAIFG